MADLAGKNILVTGGAGFIGSHIVDLLLQEDCAGIVAIDNFERGRRDNLATALLDPRVTLVEGDICDRELLARLVRNADIVFHQAALRITQCAAEPRRAVQVMVNATYDLLEQCVEAGIEKVVAASSASIYGQATHFPTAEDHHPYDDRTLYGAAKSFSEGLLRAFSSMYGLRYVALRYFNVYGPRMDISGKYTEVLIRWMQRLAEDRPPIIFGNGRQSMDLIDVRDVARANLLAAKSGVTQGAFNIASGAEVTLIELARRLAAAMDRPRIEPVFQGERSVNAVARRLAATRRAFEDFGFAAEISLERGLHDLVRWWRETSSVGVAAPVLEARA
jgi:UDP-glucose 4-epimerase